ncbi:MAG TPA: CDP-alcohol phosphatidyltransferase family protein [Acidobacteriota bacterium]|nr:CDP-alcohol phosphatidyltransferase family protein [Acidobacteriota bacterium]
MVSKAIQPVTDYLLGKIANFLSLLRLTPNILTVTGVFLNAAVAYVLVEGRFFLGAWLYLIVSMTDLLDGILARKRNMATRFGGFLDSVMDRFADAFIFAGILIHYAIISNVPCVLITLAAFAGAMITSYTRARAEVLIPKCKIGFMERPERVFLLAIGLFFNRVPICLLIMAITSLITIIDRIVFTQQELKRLEPAG